MNRIYNTVWNEISQAFVVVSEHVKRRGKRSGGSARQGGAGAVSRSQPRGRAPSSGILVLEARMMFDGAAVATAIDIAPHDVAVSNDAAVAERAVVDAHPVSTDSPATAAVAPLAEQPPSQQRNEIVFVDVGVQDYQKLIDALPANSTVVVLDSAKDGFAQMAEYLNGQNNIDAIHLISEGHEGGVHAGNTWLSLDNINSEQSNLAAIGAALKDSGDFLIYGCDVGKGADGAALLTQLANFTHADITASNDWTGDTKIGGDWVLEDQTGTIETSTLLADASYDHVLNTLNSGDMVVLGWSALSDTITFATLVDIPSGTVIKITDWGWNAAGTAFTGGTTGDGLVTWTTSSTITAGTVLNLFLGGTGDSQATTLTNITTSTDLTANIVKSGYTTTDPMGIAGDGVFIYQDSDANPYLIFGFNNSAGANIDANNWNTLTSFVTLRDSTLPGGTGSQNALTNGTNAVGVPGGGLQNDNVQYTGPTTSADRATWLSRVSNVSNWTGDSDGTATTTVGVSGGSVMTIASPATVTSVNSSTSNGFYKAGDTVSVQVNFSAAVTVTGTPQLTLETGTTDRVVNYASGSGTSALTFTYTVQAGDTSADLDYQSTGALALNSGTIKNGSTDATLTLVSPGATNSLGANKAIVIDTTAPTVSSVNSSTANATYKVGDTVSIQVNFSEAVTVTGTPQLTLETGATDRIVNYASGSGTSALTFTYTVQAGDTSADLDYQSTTALALNSGTIKDAAGNAGTLALVSPGAANSLGSNKNIVIDGVVPTVTSVNSNTSDGVYSVGDTISIQVNFSEAVTVTGTPQLTLETGATDRVVNYASGSGTSSLTFTYTVQAGDSSDDLDYQSTTALALNSGTIKDAAGNNGTLTLVSPGAANSLGANRDIALNVTPVIGNLNGDSVAWAGIGNTVTLDASSNATISDTELDALDDWAGASLTIQRAGTAVSADTFGFNMSGAPFTVNGSTIESGGTPFATFTNSGGVLTISFTSAGTTATTALVQELIPRITYRNDTPAGDATIRFSLSDGSATTTADVTVSTDSIYVTNTTDTATINLSNGVSFSEAIAIAAADVTGSQTIIFDSSLAGQTVSTSSASSLGESVTVDLDSASGVILSGGTLSIGSGFGLTVTNGTGDTASIATTLSGAGNFVKAGTGKATLSGTNNFTGTTTVSAGTLAVSGDGNLGSAAVVLNSGTTLQVTGSTTIDNAFTLSGSASIQTDSVVTLSGLLSGGAVTLTKTGGSRLTLSNTGNEAAFTGAMTVTAGTLAPTSDNSLGAGVITLNGGALTSTSGSGAVSIDNLFVIGASGGTLAASTQTLTLTGDISGPGTLSKANSQQLTLSGNNTFAGGLTVAGTNGISITNGTNLGSGTVSLNGSLFTVTGSGVTISNAMVVNLDSTISNANAVTFSGGISGGSNLTKAGAGTLTLSGTNSGAWAALVTDGALAISAANNLGSGTLSLDGGALEVTGSSFFTLSNNIDLAGAGTIIATGDASLNGDISGAGTLTKTGAALFTLGGNNTYTGATIVSAGTLVLDVDTALGTTAGGTTVSSGATLQLSEGVTTADALTLSGAGIGVGGAALYSAGNSTISGTVTLAADTAINISNSCTQTLSNVVSGGFSLTKLNLGTLILSGANTYTGATNVSGGTLAVTGSTVSATTVGSGGTLAGTGTVGGAVTVQSGGTLAPGVSGAGTLTLGNGLTIQSGGTLAVDIASATAGSGYDVVAVTGAVDVSSATLSVTHSYAPGSGDSYTIITNNVADAITGSFSGLSEGGTVTAGGNSTELTASYIGGTGNDFTLTAPANPVVTSVTSASVDGTYGIGSVVTLAVNFSEAVFLSTGTLQLSLETGSTDRVLSYISGNGTSTLYFNYTVQAGDTSLDLDYLSTAALNANGDTVQSASSFDAILTLPAPGASGSLGANAALVIDGVRPTATVVMADTALAAGETSLVTITFSEAVTGFANADLTIANGSLTPVNSSDGGITWTATFTPTASITDATNLITLNNTGVQDAAGNTGLNTTDSNNYAIDVTRPTATIAVADAALADGETSLVTITFSEAVTGFTNADLAIANGTLTPVSSSDGGITWTATFMPSANLTDTTNLITLDNTGIADTAGNSGSGVTDSNNYAIDMQLPMVTSVNVPANATYITGQALDFTVNLSEVVSVDTAGGTPRIAVTLDTGIVYADYVSGSGTNALTFRATVASGQLDTDGISLGSSIEANGGTLRDSAGNDVVAALNGIASTAGVMVDAVAPTVSDIQLQGDPQPSAQSLTFFVTFDGPVEQVDLGDFSLATSGGVSATISGLQQIDAQHWVVVVDNISGGGSIRLDVSSSSDIADPVGNALAGGFTTGATFTSQLPPVFVAAAPLVSIAPVSTSEPLLQSTPLIVLTSATTDVGGATNSGLITVDSAGIGGIGFAPVGTDPIGLSYTSYTPVRSTSPERASVNRDTSSPIVTIPTFDAGAPLSMPLPGVTAAEQSDVSLRMLDGKPLVPWLRYDPTTGLLTGQPPRGFSGKLQIQIIVRDSRGHSSIKVMELHFFSDRSGNKEGASAHDAGAEVSTNNLSFKDSQRGDHSGVDAGKLGLKDQFAHHGAAGRARDASALLSALDQLAAVNSRSRSA